MENTLNKVCILLDSRESNYKSVCFRDQTCQVLLLPKLLISAFCVEPPPLGDIESKDEQP